MYDNSEVRVVAIIALAAVLIFSGLFTMAYAIHAGNVKAATACVQSGGQWLNSREGSGDAQMECARP